MKILFHVGVGNLDRPYRWQFVNGLFSQLAVTFERLGHQCLLWRHSAAPHPLTYRNNMVSDSVAGQELVAAKIFNPDRVFTWNGASEGDQIIVQEFGKDKMIFAELGFFNHYNTLYFDFKIPQRFLLRYYLP